MDDKKYLLLQVLDAYNDDITEISKDLKHVKQEKTESHKKNVEAFKDAAVVIEMHGVGKKYKLGKQEVVAANNVSLSIKAGEIVALMGPSGSGKSTLMNMIGGLDKPSEGSVIVDGVDLKKLSDRKLSAYRNQKIGFVFQFFYLQPFLKLSSNIALPTVFSRMPKKIRAERVSEYASSVGLEDRLSHYPKELSGGQMQRAAIARALMNRPKIILADEPTGNLDSTNAYAIMDLFKEARDKHGITVIVVTHDPKVASIADRIITLKDGAIMS